MAGIYWNPETIRREAMTILYGIVGLVLGLALAVSLGLALYKENEPIKAPENLPRVSKLSEAWRQLFIAKDVLQKAGNTQQSFQRDYEKDRDSPCPLSGYSLACPFFDR